MNYMTPAEKRNLAFRRLCEMDKLPPTLSNRRRVNGLRAIAARYLGIQMVNFPSNP